MTSIGLPNVMGLAVASTVPGENTERDNGRPGKTFCKSDGERTGRGGGGINKVLQSFIFTPGSSQKVNEGSPRSESAPSPLQPPHFPSCFFLSSRPLSSGVPPRVFLHPLPGYSSSSPTILQCTPSRSWASRASSSTRSTLCPSAALTGGVSPCLPSGERPGACSERLPCFCRCDGLVDSGVLLWRVSGLRERLDVREQCVACGEEEVSLWLG